MNRKQYMEKLNMDLEGMPQQSRLEIIQDFDSHFQQGLQEGKTEEEIAEELGDLDVLTKELKSSTPIKSTSSSHEKSEVCDVEINSLCADLIISRSEDDQVHVHFYDRKDPLARLNYDLITMQTNSLYTIQVKTKKSSLSNFFRFGEDLRLEVQLPCRVVNLKAESVSGDVLCDLSCDKIFIKSVSGDIAANQINCDQLFIENVSGDCKVNINQVQTYSVKIISGDMKIDCKEAQKGKLSNVSGDIDYRGDTKEIAVQTKAGDVKLDLIDAQTCRINQLSQA